MDHHDEGERPPGKTLPARPTANCPPAARADAAGPPTPALRTASPLGKTRRTAHARVALTRTARAVAARLRPGPPPAGPAEWTAQEWDLAQQSIARHAPRHARPGNG